MNYNKEAKSLTFRRGSEVSQGFWGFGVLHSGLGFRIWGFGVLYMEFPKIRGTLVWTPENRILLFLEGQGT